MHRFGQKSFAFSLALTYLPLQFLAAACPLCLTSPLCLTPSLAPSASRRYLLHSHSRRFPFPLTHTASPSLKLLSPSRSLSFCVSQSLRLCLGLSRRETLSPSRSLSFRVSRSLRLCLGLSRSRLTPVSFTLTLMVFHYLSNICKHFQWRFDFHVLKCLIWVNIALCWNVWLGFLNFEMYSHCVGMFDLGFFTGTFRRGCRGGFTVSWWLHSVSECLICLVTNWHSYILLSFDYQMNIYRSLLFGCNGIQNLFGLRIIILWCKHV